MNSIKNEMTPLDYLTVEPKKKADACVIWLHGLGADGTDFVDTVPTLRLPESHGIRFIFPHAPKRPITINQGMVMPAWYDIASFDFNQEQDAPGIQAAMQKLGSLIEEVMTSGILPHRIVLVGFSQGGALALYTTLRFPQRLGGAAGLSCYLPLHTEFKPVAEDEIHSIPLFLAHGLMDPIVPYGIGKQSFEFLQSAGYAPVWYTYPIAHTICLPEMVALGSWMQKILA